jgi:hypothetical protein
MYCCDHRCSSIRYYVDSAYFAWVGAKENLEREGLALWRKVIAITP